jgi:hypothetical protein
LGNPLRFLLTGGQRHDITQADDLIAAFDFERVIADRSYDAEEFLSRIAENEAEAVIPPRKNRKEPREYDHHLYKERHLDRMFLQQNQALSASLLKIRENGPASIQGLGSWDCL